jgi:hypothetical protein
VRVATTAGIYGIRFLRDGVPRHEYLVRQSHHKLAALTQACTAYSDAPSMQRD